MMNTPLESRCRILFSLLALIVIVSMDQVPGVILGHIALLTVGALEKISFNTYYKRILAVLPFLSVMLLTLFFALGITEESVSLLLNMIFKAFSGILAVCIMTTGRTSYEFWLALAQLKTPDVLMSVLFLSTRYAFVFLEKVKRVQNALRARLFIPRLGKNTLKIYGEVAGGMILSSLEHGERVYKAMLARGFDGRFPYTTPQKLKFSDKTKFLLYSSLFLIILVLEKR